MEGCLAVAEVTLPTNMSVTASGGDLAPARTSSGSSSSSSSSPGQTPQSPQPPVQEEESQDEAGKGLLLREGASPRAPVDSDPAVLSIGGSKPEDMLWFHRAVPQPSSGTSPGRTRRGWA